MSDDFFAPPPFDPATALATLKRTLRDLKLVERSGAFELNGQPVVRARVEDATLKLDIARRPSRSPDWEHADLATLLARMVDLGWRRGRVELGDDGHRGIPG